MHPKRTVARSFARAALATLAVTLLGPGCLFAATDAPQHRPKPKAHHHRTQPASAPQDRSSASQAAPSADKQAPADKPAAAEPERPAAVVLDNREVFAVLGSDVRSAVDENMGRIVDVLVDQSGRVRAAVIDFGGFLGVGSRKIAVDWSALHFSPDQERNRVVLEMTREQVKAAPEYQPGKPVVVLNAVADPERIRFTTETPKR